MTQHNRMVLLPERMLDPSTSSGQALHKKLPKAKGAAKATIERQIAATDKTIDELVYELYGLTEEEVAIVERSENAQEAQRRQVPAGE
ncbi:MAG: hypothetical protein R6X12_01680 [bacterium]